MAVLLPIWLVSVGLWLIFDFFVNFDCLNVIAKIQSRKSGYSVRNASNAVTILGGQRLTFLTQLRSL